MTLPPPPPLEVHPSLINTACPWATTLDDLRRLYACPATGAVTTRTSMLNGFDHDPAKHQYAFFDAAQSGPAQNASLNSLGYSPHPLSSYLAFIRTISYEQPARSSKVFIVSVTGTPADIAASYALLATAAPTLHFPLAMEINLSCPNIPDHPPPAYSREALTTYLTHLQHAITTTTTPTVPRIPVGLKTPPYTYTTQFTNLISALTISSSDNGCPISFLTATNTLGNSLLFLNPSREDSQNTPSSESTPVRALPGEGIGGLAGSPLHPLALGNVATLRRMLDEAGFGGEGSSRVRIVGVGGVMGADGYRRMRAAGAEVVGLATGLGVKGVGVFGEVEEGLGGRW